MIVLEAGKAEVDFLISDRSHGRVDVLLQAGFERGPQIGITVIR